MQIWGDGVMKNILFISKFNIIMKELNQSLLETFHVQLCLPDESLIRSILSVINPDAVLVCLSGIEDCEDRVFSIIDSCMPGKAVFVLGTEAEMNRCNAMVKCSRVRVYRLSRPIGNEEVRIQIEQTLEQLESQGLDDLMMLLNGEDNMGLQAKEERTKHILCVDDDEMALEIMSLLLGEKYRVSLASCAMKAIRMINNDKPDLIIMDYEMPDVNGCLLMKLLRGEEDLCDIPVVFQTSRTDREGISSVMSLNPAGYTFKPIDPKHITLTVENILA